jgi:hypothetical protein
MVISVRQNTTSYRRPREITFLRHPVDNLITIYYFWKTCSEGHCLFNYFRDNQLSVLELASIPSIRYLFSKTYFGGIDMGSFDFIGFTENYSKDLNALSRLLYIPLVEVKDNINEYPDYEFTVSAIKSDLVLMSKLRDRLIDDIRFYEGLRSRLDP